MLRVRSGFIEILAAMVLYPCATAQAQEIRGAILGRVIDASGAGVAGAKVTAVHEATNVPAEATSNVEGNYLPFLAPSRHTITVVKEGFNRSRREGVLLETQHRVTAGFSRHPGDLVESVAVDSEAPLLQTASADFGQAMGSEFMSRLRESPESSVADYTTSYIQMIGTTSRGNRMTIDGAPARRRPA